MLIVGLFRVLCVPSLLHLFFSFSVFPYSFSSSLSFFSSSKHNVCLARCRRGFARAAAKSLYRFSVPNLVIAATCCKLHGKLVYRKAILILFRVRRKYAFRKSWHDVSKALNVGERISREKAVELNHWNGEIRRWVRGSQSDLIVEPLKAESLMFLRRVPLRLRFCRICQIRVSWLSMLQCLC